MTLEGRWSKSYVNTLFCHFHDNMMHDARLLQSQLWHTFGHLLVCWLAYLVAWLYNVSMGAGNMGVGSRSHATYRRPSLDGF